MKLISGVRRTLGEPFDFGADPHLDPDPGIFNEFFSSSGYGQL